ncbi:MAG: hypothetical protein QCI38_03080 [Candidatus Thermoplasmatota archaeon]|nr:hypothetical protein [Candidatus Thermoplasmatota archaeon]
MVYSFLVPKGLLEAYETEKLQLHGIVSPVVNKALQTLEEALYTPSNEEFVIHRYDNYSGRNVVWRGSTRHDMHFVELPLSEQQHKHIITVIERCTSLDVDHRQLYWSVLIKPHAPKGTTQAHKEMLQSRELASRSMTLLVYAILYGHLLWYQSRPAGQTILGGC